MALHQLYSRNNYYTRKTILLLSSPALVFALGHTATTTTTTATAQATFCQSFQPNNNNQNNIHNNMISPEEQEEDVKDQSVLPKKDATLIMTKSEKKDERIWSKIAEGYSKQPIKDDATYQKKLATTRKYLTKSSNVLEFGCGTGSTALLHAPFVKHIHATDISSKMIDIAQTKAQEQGITNVHFEQTSLDGIAVVPAEENTNGDDDCRYDAVLGLNILHLLPDRKGAIHKVHDLLKPGGVFVSSTFLIKDFAGNGILASAFSSLLKFGSFCGLAPTVNFFSERELKETLNDAGFEIQEEFRADQAHHSIFIVAKKKE